MFFNKHIKAAPVIATTIENMVRVCFSGSGRISESGVFHAPYGFWLDDYVIGFLTTVSRLMLRHDIGFNPSDSLKNLDFMGLFLEYLCKGDAQAVMRRYRQCGVVPGTSQDFDRGADEGTLYYFSMKGAVKRDFTSPVYEEAKIMAESVHELSKEASEIHGLGPSGSSQSLGTAVFMLTFQKHVSDKYLDAED